MNIYFLDSSALVKRYIQEAGTNWIRTITLPSAGNYIFISMITPAEVISAVSRQKREGNISARTARAIRLTMDRHVLREYEVVEVLDSIVQQAEDLLDTYPLRAYDAIQLATMQYVQQTLLGYGFATPIFVSADQRLLSVAKSENLLLDNPNQYP